MFIVFTFICVKFLCLNLDYIKFLLNALINFNILIYDYINEIDISNSSLN